MIVASNVLLKGERVSFTPLQMENIYQHFDWNNDLELNRLDSVTPFVKETFGDFKRRFECMLAVDSQDSRDFEIHTDDGTLIGVAYIANFCEHNRHCTAGITIGNREYWGKGYGRDAISLLMHHCFEDLSMHRISTETFEFNDAWRRLVKWAGFEREGLIAEYINVDGRFYDMELYGILEGAYRYRKLHQMAGR